MILFILTFSINDVLLYFISGFVVIAILYLIHKQSMKTVYGIFGRL